MLFLTTRGDTVFKITYQLNLIVVVHLAETVNGSCVYRGRIFNNVLHSHVVYVIDSAPYHYVTMRTGLANCI